MPQVSVIIPTYNRAETVRVAITSVLSQSFRDFELIVVDDASVDHTASVVQGFNDPRIKYVRNASNKGEGGSRNTGLLNAQGDFIAFLDDDDEWLPEKLKLQVELLDRSPPTIGIIYTGYSKIDTTTGKTLLQLFPSKRGKILNDILEENCIATSTVLARKLCFEKAGLFEEGVAFGADYDLWIRISQLFEFDYIKEVLVNYYIHGNNITRNYDAVINGLELQLAKYHSFWITNRKTYSYRLLSLGVLYCYTGNIKKGRTALCNAVKLHPLEVRHYYNLFLCLLGTNCFRKITDGKESLVSRLRAMFFPSPDDQRHQA